MMPSAGLWMLLAVAVTMIATGLPVWVVLIAVAGVASLLGLALGAFGASILMAMPARLLGLLENDLLQALPLYAFMGAMLNHLPLSHMVFRSVSRALSRTGAGAPLAGLGLATLFAPMNGSVGASVEMLSRTVLPRLDAAGLSAARGAALVSVSSTLGVLLPPSLVLILLGDAMLRAHTEAVNITHAATRIINTQDIFRGALIPAAILLTIYLVLTWWLTRNRAQDTTPSPGARDWLVAGATISLIVGLLAAVTFGFIYAVEAAATGAFVLTVAAAVSGALRREVLRSVLKDTLAITGALFALLIGATIFTLVLRAFETDRWIAAMLNDLAVSPQMLLIGVLLLLGLCALVLDAFEMIFVVIPVVMPPLLVRVPDATWVAVLTLLILQASFMVPPVGYAILMLKSRLARPVANRELARALAPYLAALLLVLGAVLAAPQLIWRGPAAAEAPQKTLSDDALFEMMNRQLEENSQTK